MVTLHHIPCAASVEVQLLFTILQFLWILPFLRCPLCIRGRSQTLSSLHGLLSGVLWLSKVGFVTIGYLLIPLFNKVHVDGPIARDREGKAIIARRWWRSTVVEIGSHQYNSRQLYMCDFMHL